MVYHEYRELAESRFDGAGEPASGPEIVDASPYLPVAHVRILGDGSRTNDGDVVVSALYGKERENADVGAG